MPGKIHQLSRPHNHGPEVGKKNSPAGCRRDEPETRGIAMLRCRRPRKWRWSRTRDPRGRARYVLRVQVGGARVAGGSSISTAAATLVGRRDHTSYTLELRHEGPDDVQVQREDGVLGHPFFHAEISDHITSVFYYITSTSSGANSANNF